MSLPRLAFFVLAVTALGLFGLEATSQQQEPVQGQQAPRVTESKSVPTIAGVNEILQEFPTNDAPKTAWKVRWSTSRGNGLTIQEAWLRRASGEPFIQVLGDVRLGEMFVPYHSGTPRFWDISYNFNLIPVGRDEAGPFGKVLGSPPNVVAELRDRGVMWMDSPTGTRRGQALVLWGCLDAANYRYIMEYGFQDDGVVTCRVGSTGRNYASREFEGHMHHGMWRIDLNLDGGANNSVYVMEHNEPDREHRDRARTDTRPFNNGKEGFEDWTAEKFTMLMVLGHTRKNARGKPISYDVCVPRMGVARHHGPDDEGCTQHDFWVTKNRPGELSYKKVPNYIKKGESILNTDVVVWVNTPCHHEPRSEDGEMRGSNFSGATPVAWGSLELRPRNFFDRTPHYNYPPTKK